MERASLPGCPLPASRAVTTVACNSRDFPTRFNRLCLADCRVQLEPRSSSVAVLHRGREKEKRQDEVEKEEEEGSTSVAVTTINCQSQSQKFRATFDV